MVQELRLEAKEANIRHARMEETLNRVLEQAIKTNGRVTVNTTDIKRIDDEQIRFRTIATTLTSLVGVVWAGVTFFFK